MSGDVVVSDGLVDRQIHFTNVYEGWFVAVCDECDVSTSGGEPTVEEWAYEHVLSNRCDVPLLPPEEGDTAEDEDHDGHGNDPVAHAGESADDQSQQHQQDEAADGRDADDDGTRRIKTLVRLAHVADPTAAAAFEEALWDLVDYFRTMADLAAMNRIDMPHLLQNPRWAYAQALNEVTDDLADLLLEFT